MTQESLILIGTVVLVLIATAVFVKTSFVVVPENAVNVVFSERRKPLWLRFISQAAIVLFVALCALGACGGMITMIAGVSGVCMKILHGSASVSTAYWALALLALDGLLGAFVCAAVMLVAAKAVTARTFQVVFSGFTIPAGIFLAWAALGMQGVLGFLHLDTWHVFDYAEPHPVGWILFLSGAGMAILGACVTCMTPEQFARMRAR